MFRSFWLTFFTKPRDHHIHENAHESPFTITVPLMVLATLAIVAGFGWKDAFLPAEGKEAYVAFARSFTEEDHVWHHAHQFALYVSLVVCFLGIGLSAFCYLTPAGERARKAARAAISPVYEAAKAKFWMDEFIEAFIIWTTIKWSEFTAFVDRDVIDGFVDGAGSVSRKTGDASGVADITVVDGAVDGTGLLAWGGGGILSRFQSGRIRNYLFGAVAMTALFAVIVLYMSRS
jgi:NADH-quinone oxidoreductase subunit L